MAEISNPLGFIDGLFVSAMAQNGGKLDTDEYGEHRAYEELMRNPEFVEKIPYLSKASLGRIPHNSLVRYRGLVQDVYNEEYFTGVYVQNTVDTDSGALHSSKLVLSKYRHRRLECPCASFFRPIPFLLLLLFLFLFPSECYSCVRL